MIGRGELYFTLNLAVFGSFAMHYASKVFSNSRSNNSSRMKLNLRKLLENNNCPGDLLRLLCETKYARKFPALYFRDTVCIRVQVSKLKAGST